MRLVFANPHTHNYGRSVLGVLLRRKDFLKYDYFIDYIVKNKGKKVAFFIDGTRSSFSGIGLSGLFSFKIVAYVELIIWMIINGVNPFRIKVHFSVNKLDPKNDVLIDFSRSIVDVDDQTRLSLHEFGGLVFIHFTHYFKNVEKLSAYIKKIQNLVVIAESDLSKNDFFQSHFPEIAHVYHLPFAFADRFIPTCQWQSRLNKCLAIGSITRVKDPTFLDFFNNPEGLHPMRKIIYESSDSYRDTMDSLIRGFEDTTRARQTSPDDSLIIQIVKRHLPFFLLEKIYPTPQISYFKFDIVKKLNEYRMFLCPEESVGLPSINAIEGMAAGTAYFGIDDDMYTGIGLIPGVHYIAYKKDDLKDLVSKIRDYQIREKDLERIADSGSRYVRERFSRKQVASVLCKDFESILSKFAKSGEIYLICSFRNSNR